MTVPRGILCPIVFLSSTHLEEHSGAFLAARHPPRACRVYELTRITIDVPLWRLICQAYPGKSARLDTSGIGNDRREDCLSLVTLENSRCIDYRESMKRALQESRFSVFLSTRTIVTRRATIVTPLFPSQPRGIIVIHGARQREEESLVERDGNSRWAIPKIIGGAYGNYE